MPREKRQFENGELYHISLRRIADEILFKDINDYFRGVFGIYEFNNANHVSITKRRRDRAQFKKRALEIGRGQTPANLGWGLTPTNLTEIQQVAVEQDKRLKIVQVLSFVLMPNHLHLILRQLVDKGISLFMQKFGSGLAAYFFERYHANIKKKGHFFQDRFEAVHVKTDEQLKVVFVYIHTNPISLIEPKWKEYGIEKPEKVIKFVENYKWSSYSDYIGKKNFPSVTEREFILKVIGGEKGCREWVERWIKHKAEIKKLMEKFSNLALE